MHTYRGAEMGWPTADRVIPIRLFFVLEGEWLGVSAQEQLETYYATLLAGAQVHGNASGKSERDAAVKELSALAHPDTADE